MEIDAVEQRTRKPRLILRDAARIGLAVAGEARVRRMAAAAGIHRRDELKSRRIDDAMIGAGDGDLAGLDRLAQAVQNLGLEFRQLIEKQDAMMGERNLARPRPRAAADQSRHRGRMMRRAKRAPIGQRAAGEIAGDRMNQRDFEQFARRQRRQDRGQAARRAWICRRRAAR